MSWWLAELKPAPAVCIVDTDLRLELDAPLAPARDAAVLRGRRCGAGRAAAGAYVTTAVAPRPVSEFKRKVCVANLSE